MAVTVHWMFTLMYLLLLQQGQTNAWFSKPEIGSLQRDKPYDQYYVGENLTLHCHKFSPFVGDVELEYGNVDVEKKYVSVVNSTYARMDKPITDADFGQTNYVCADADGLIGDLGSTYVDYPPQNATDLHIIWQNKSEVDITWTFGGIKYKNSRSERLVKFTAEWSSDNEMTWTTCIMETATSCKILSLYDASASISVRVNVTIVRRNDTLPTVFPAVPIIEKAKPAAVESVTVSAINSTSVQLVVTSNWPSLNYTISYYTIGENQEDRGMMVTGMTADTAWVLTGLHPHYNYRFDVRAQFEQGYISDLPRNFITLQMPEDAPSSPPVIPPASYYLDESGCSLRDPSATLYIYFQDVPEEYQNGNIVNYTAEVLNRKFTQSGTAHTLAMDSLPCGTGFSVTVYASTRIGRSPAASLSVQRNSQEIDEIQENLKMRIRITDSGDVTAEWTPPVSVDGLSLFLYFCTKSSARAYQCEDAVNYIQVSPKAAQHPLVSATSVMNFGLAVKLHQGQTNGIRFTNCIYNPARGPGEPPSGLRALPQEDHIIVLWEAQECDDSRLVVIFSYDIELCSVSAPSICQNYIADGGSSSYKLDEVEFDTTYSVRIRANTTKSMTPYSNVIQAVLPKPGESGFPVGGIVGIVLVGVLFLIIVPICLICKFRDKILKTKIKFSSTSGIQPPDQTGPMSHISINPVSGSISQISNGVINRAYSHRGSDFSMDMNINPVIGSIGAPPISITVQNSHNEHGVMAAAQQVPDVEDETRLATLDGDTTNTLGGTLSENLVPEYVGINQISSVNNQTHSAVIPDSHLATTNQEHAEHTLTGGSGVDDGGESAVGNVENALSSSLTGSPVGGYVRCVTTGEDAPSMSVVAHSPGRIPAPWPQQPVLDGYMKATITDVVSHSAGDSNTDYPETMVLKTSTLPAVFMNPLEGEPAPRQQEIESYMRVTTVEGSQDIPERVSQPFVLLPDPSVQHEQTEWDDRLVHQHNSEQIAGLNTDLTCPDSHDLFSVSIPRDNSEVDAAHFDTGQGKNEMQEVQEDQTEKRPSDSSWKAKCVGTPDDYHTASYIGHSPLQPLPSLEVTTACFEEDSSHSQKFLPTPDVEKCNTAQAAACDGHASLHSDTLPLGHLSCPSVVPECLPHTAQNQQLPESRSSGSTTGYVTCSSVTPVKVANTPLSAPNLQSAASLHDAVTTSGISSYVSHSVITPVTAPTTTTSTSAPYVQSDARLNDSVPSSETSSYVSHSVVTPVTVPTTATFTSAPHMLSDARIHGCSTSAETTGYVSHSSVHPVGVNSASAPQVENDASVCKHSTPAEIAGYVSHPPESISPGIPSTSSTSTLHQDKNAHSSKEKCVEEVSCGDCSENNLSRSDPSQTCETVSSPVGNVSQQVNNDLSSRGDGPKRNLGLVRLDSGYISPPHLEDFKPTWNLNN